MPKCPHPKSRTINGSEALIIKRESVRALLLTSAHDLLLMRILGWITMRFFGSRQVAVLRKANKGSRR